MDEELPDADGVSGGLGRELCVQRLKHLVEQALGGRYAFYQFSRHLDLVAATGESKNHRSILHRSE